METDLAALARIRAAAEAGACIAWIRNSVDAALKGAAALRAAGLDPDLFHARFAMGDRLAIEARVRARFGKEAPPEGRRGRVLVAIQVAESALDLDFDLMVTDLAPIDSVLQRAGRLWRGEGAWHREAASGRSPARRSSWSRPTRPG